MEENALVSFDIDIPLESYMELLSESNHRGISVTALISDIIADYIQKGEQ